MTTTQSAVAQARVHHPAGYLRTFVSQSGTTFDVRVLDGKPVAVRRHGGKLLAGVFQDTWMQADVNLDQIDAGVATHLVVRTSDSGEIMFMTTSVTEILRD